MIFNFALNAKMGALKNGREHGWNDPDMLQVGNNGMSFDEQETHMQLWAIVKSPLFISTDIQKLAQPEMKKYLNLLKNKYLIQINQDPLGLSAICVVNCDSEYIS